MTRRRIFVSELVNIYRNYRRMREHVHKINFKFMYHNKIIGNFGENIACDYLIKRGYRIVARNYRAKYREIDIIAFIKGVLVFVEVKTRTGDRYGGLENAIFGKKIRLFVKAVDSYLISHKISDDKFRLDYLAIDLNKDKKTAKIKHYIDFF